MFDETDIFRRGVALQENKDYDLAIESFSEAIKIRPTYAEAYYARGNCYEAKGRPDEAIEDYNEVLRFSPGEAVAYYKLAL